MANPVLTKQFGDPAVADATLGSATPTILSDGTRMSIGSVIAATAVLLALVMGGAAYGWANAVAVQRWYWVFVISLVVLVVVTVLRPQLAPITGSIYALGEGAFVGSISKVYETFYDGIVLQAILATFAVFVAMLFLYGTRIVKVTEKFRSVVILATVGIGLFYLFSWIVSLFGSNIPVLAGAGRGALIFSAIVVIVAALNLLLDFQVIEQGISAEAPKVMSWFAAFGLMVTIIWLYLEILRLLSIILRRN